MWGRDYLGLTADRRHIGFCLWRFRVQGLGAHDTKPQALNPKPMSRFTLASSGIKAQKTHKRENGESHSHNPQSTLDQTQ